MSQLSTCEKKELLKRHVLLLKSLLKNFPNDEDEEKWQLLRNMIHSEKR